MANRRNGYTTRQEFDGLKKTPYATIPLEVVDTFLNLSDEDEAARALWAYVKYVLFGVEDIPEPLAIVWPLLKDKADRTLGGIRNVKKRADRGTTVAPNPNPKVDPKIEPSLAPTLAPTVAPSLLNQNQNQNHNQNLRNTMSGKPDRAPVIREIVGYLNDKTGKAFKPNSQATARLIQARLNEGFTVDDFKAVIDNMAAKWGKDPKMCEYLRPQTLFGTKFESYLQVGGLRNDYSAYDC